MFDLDGDVVGQAGELACQRSDQLARVPRAVEKVGIAERDVPRPVLHLPPDVLEHDGDGDDAEAAVVDGNDGTVPAAMLAAAARLGIAGDAPFAANLHRRVARESRKPAAIGDQELHAREIHRRAAGIVVRPGAGHHPHQVVLELAANDVTDAALVEQRLIERCIQTVGNQLRVRIRGADAVDQRQRQPRGGVHRQEEGDRIGPGHRPRDRAAAWPGRGR